MAAVRSIAAVGVTYAAIGIVLAWPTSHVHVWRAGAWVLSAIIYSTHIAHERFRLSNRPRRAALHVALAVVIGGFGLALSALLRSIAIMAPAQHTRLLFIALVAWPLLTGTPAFVVALCVSALLPLKSSRSRF